MISIASRSLHGCRASRAAWALLAFSLPLAASAARASTAAPAAPVEGLWLGSASSALERVEIGLEVRRNDAGELTIPFGN